MESISQNIKEKIQKIEGYLFKNRNDESFLNPLSFNTSQKLSDKLKSFTKS